MVRSLARSGLVMAVCLLGGCGSGYSGKSVVTQRSEAAVPGAVPPAGNRVTGTAVRPEGQSVPEGVRSSPHGVSADSVVARCDRELKVLKRLDAKRHALRRAQFDRLMSGASVYADIRKDVTGGTQDTVDAMYRFRTGKLCAEISRDVLEALARQEGGAG